MKGHFLSALALLTFVTLGAVSATTIPAAAVAGPVCAPGFSTTKDLSWLLECRKTVPIAQKNATVAAANNAVCETYSYWNYGPHVTVTVKPLRGLATVKYICGHVEG